MKTSYQILWIDDDLDSIEEPEFAIREFLDEYGIELKTKKISQDSQNMKTIECQIDNPDLDIIMIDYLLGEANGDRVIRTIRDNDQYLPVIFYSSADIEKLFNAVNESHLDGVYIATRYRLVHKAENVIKSLIKKEQSTKRTRGLLLEGVSEIDAQLGQIIVDSWDEIDSDGQSQFLEFYRAQNLYPRVNGRFRRINSYISNSVEFRRHLVNRINTRSYSTKNRCRIAIELLQIRGVDPTRIAVLSKFIHDNGQDMSLNQIRNDYAHKTREVLESDHSEEKCINIRRMLRKQFDNIESIRNL